MGDPIADVADHDDLETVFAQLSRAGFVAAAEEAAELIACSGGSAELLRAMLARRLTGEPLAWITGNVLFCGLEIHVDVGVYVPRWQSEPLARRALERLPETGVAVDVCTGAGAIAKVLALNRLRARVLACDVDERAVACATANGLEAYRGDLFASLPPGLEGKLDVVVGVVPYVPHPALGLLAHDTFVFESPLAYDGGPEGTDVLLRVVTDSSHLLRRGGALLLELGGDQATVIESALVTVGFVDVRAHIDEDGDLRSIEATLAGGTC
jgi:release factor glutamine methyltransferase